MNALTNAKSISLGVEVSSFEPVASPVNNTRLVPARGDDSLTRCHRRFASKLRAACRQYVGKEDVEDLMQDVWVVAAQRPAKLVESDARTLSWLIGIAKRCAPSYVTVTQRHLPLDDLLAREAGDDLEGRAMHEDVDELRALLWGQ